MTHRAVRVKRRLRENMEPPARNAQLLVNIKESFPIPYFYGQDDAYEIPLGVSTIPCGLSAKPAEHRIKFKPVDIILNIELPGLKYSSL
jgi:hypothetical protein